MWHDLVSKADVVMGWLALGVLNTCSYHPMLTVGFLALVLVLACTMWVQAMELRLETARALPERPIQLRRRRV